MNFKKIGSVALASVLALSMAACSNSDKKNAGTQNDTENTTVVETDVDTEITQTEPNVETESDVSYVSYEKDGFVLTIPTEISNIVTVDTENEKFLFSAYETASVEQAKADGEPEEADWGWLFDITKVSEDDAQKYQMSDMSGMNIFAKDEDGNYFVMYHPTDVRLYRTGLENMSPEDEAVQGWTIATQWAYMTLSQFVIDNNLIAVTVENTDVDMILANLAYAENATVSLVSTGGTFDVTGSEDYAQRVDALRNGASFEYEQVEEAPDGEYIIVKVDNGESNVRMDVFSGDMSLVRICYNDDMEYPQYFRATYEDGAEIYNLVSDWYNAYMNVETAENVETVETTETATTETADTTEVVG